MRKEDFLYDKYFITKKRVYVSNCNAKKYCIFAPHYGLVE